MAKPKTALNMLKLRRYGETLNADVFQLMIHLAEQQGLHLTDFPSDAGLIKNLSTLMSKVHTPIRIYGRRVEEMFYHVVAALGEIKAIRREDCGAILTSINEEIAIPDFRLVLKNQTEILVEVKSCNKSSLRFTSEYLDCLGAYGTLFMRPVYLAVYWRRFKMWTLHPIDSIKSTLHKGNNKISFFSAITENHMQLLGDAMLGCKPPLSLRFGVRSQEVDRKQGTVTLLTTIQTVDFFCAGVRLQTNKERSIAFGLMMHGQWHEHEPKLNYDKGELTVIEFVFEPVDFEGNEDFAVVASLSTLASSLFNDLTIDQAGIRQLRPRVPITLPYPRPRDDYKSKRLPLWRFIVRPRSLGN
jgi:hypothetical protein